MDLITRVGAKKARLGSLRVSDPKSFAALAGWYDVELTYTSNAIEGNTLSRIETALILENGIAGITIGGKPLKDHLEVIGHAEALHYVRSLATVAHPVREVDIRAIHSLVMARVDPAESGKYSDHQRFIKGSAVVLPAPWELAPLMNDFGKWLEAALPGPDSAFEAHARLVAIHPFSDGNGRTARLLMNLLLLQSGYPPVLIGPEDRLLYIDALQQLQLKHDGAAYRKFMYARLESSLDDYLKRLSPR
jgi:Fic family protein